MEERPRGRTSRSSRNGNGTNGSELEASFRQRPSNSSRNGGRSISPAETGGGRPSLTRPQMDEAEVNRLQPGMRVTISGHRAPRDMQGMEAVLIECSDSPPTNGSNWRVRFTDGSGQESVLSPACFELTSATSGLHNEDSPGFDNDRMNGFAAPESLLDSTSDGGPPRLTPPSSLNLKHPSKKSLASYAQTFTSAYSDVRYEGLRLILNQVLMSRGVESAILVLTMANFIITCVDTDSKAAGETAPVYVEFLQVFFVSAVVFEFSIRVYVERLRVIFSIFGWLDLWIIVSGTLDYIVQAGILDLGGYAVLSVLRVSRVLRLIRIVRYLKYFREVMKVTQMLGSCCRSLFWSTVVLAIVMTAWAALAVEVLHPLVQELADAGMWADCERCRRSFSSVLHADLTLFQIVVAGDSWGSMAIPLIESKPSTAVIFIGALLTILFGAMNMVVAVLVDTFADVRAQEQGLSRGSEMQFEETEDKRALFRIFDKIDEDGNGGLSYEEMKAGAGKVSEFRHWLRNMGLDSTDMQQLFHMCDEDNNGEIDPDEFMEAFYKIKTNQTKTSTKFVKHLVTKLSQDTSHLEKRLQEKLNKMEAEVHGSTALVQKGLAEGIPKVVDNMAVKVVERTEETQARSDETMRQRLEEQMESMEATFQQATREALEIALRTAADTTRHLLQAASRKTERAMAAAKAAAPPALPDVGQESVAESHHSEERPKRQLDDAPPDLDLDADAHLFWDLPNEAKGLWDKVHDGGHKLWPIGGWWADKPDTKPEKDRDRQETFLPSEHSLAEGPPEWQYGSPREGQSPGSLGQSPVPTPRWEEGGSLQLAVEDEGGGSEELDGFLPDDPCQGLGGGPLGKPSTQLRSFLPEGFQPRPPRPRKPRPPRLGRTEKDQEESQP